MEKKSNDLAPHKTVIWITAITYELLPTGECSGIPVKKTQEVLQVSGENKAVCLERTNKLMEELKNVRKKES